MVPGLKIRINQYLQVILVYSCNSLNSTVIHSILAQFEFSYQNWWVLFSMNEFESEPKKDKPTNLAEVCRTVTFQFLIWRRRGQNVETCKKVIKFVFWHKKLRRHHPQDKQKKKTRFLKFDNKIAQPALLYRGETRSGEWSLQIHHTFDRLLSAFRDFYRLKKKNDHLCGLCNEPNLLTRVSGYLMSKLPRLRKSQVLNLELSSLLLLEVFYILTVCNMLKPFLIQSNAVQIFLMKMFKIMQTRNNNDQVQ